MCELIKGNLLIFQNDSFDEIHCSSVFGYIEDFENFLRWFVRVLKRDGTAHVFVPHFSMLRNRSSVYTGLIIDRKEVSFSVAHVSWFPLYLQVFCACREYRCFDANNF